ncbi:hypothetical protein Lalb_Chr24g0393241 [Lupinus albus]|uniref:Uncharacterized protein n=1 Tax=Lupinus albus TaxID=3870 RepID=A0A6A4N6X2_LUPAL|nr:hypothetical protein Lalb_Chr24g0393241 [Lupinus albus]
MLGGTSIMPLMLEIRFMIERDGSAKGIVFSQFTPFLDLIGYSLDKVNLIKTCYIKCMRMVTWCVNCSLESVAFN